MVAGISLPIEQVHHYTSITCSLPTLLLLEVSLESLKDSLFDLYIVSKPTQLI